MRSLIVNVLVISRGPNAEMPVWNRSMVRMWLPVKPADADAFNVTDERSGVGTFGTPMPMSEMVEKSVLAAVQEMPPLVEGLPGEQASVMGLPSSNASAFRVGAACAIGAMPRTNAEVSSRHFMVVPFEKAEISLRNRISTNRVNDKNQ
jgi:hypothetical protein